MIEVSGLTKAYNKHQTAVSAVDNLNLSIDEGDFMVVHGPSGSGKTTLLLTLGGMLRPTAGTVSYKGEDIYALSAARRNRYRKYEIGFIFQKFFLIPYLSTFDNIRLPLALRRNGCNTEKDNADKTIRTVARRLGIAERLNHRPAELSAGEQQRVAMARTLAGGPAVILADEPTGNLDDRNTHILAECLTEENRNGRTVILVTHNKDLLGLGNRSLRLDSGKVG